MGIAPKKMFLASRRVTLVAAVVVACVAVTPGLADARSKRPDNAITQLAKQALGVANHDSRAGFTKTGWAATATTGFTTGVQVSNKAYRGKNKTNYFVASLTATDLTTGARTKLLARRGTIPFGLATGYGRTYGLWFRIDSLKRQQFRMQLMDLSDPSKPRAVFSTRVKRDDYCLPGRLTGVTAQGEAVLIRPLDADKCDYEQAFYGDYGRITAVAPDGQQRQLVARSKLDGPVISRGNFMLYRKGIRSVVLNLTTGASSDVWDGAFNHLDLSASGDVILNAPVDRDGTGACEDCEDAPKAPSNPLLLFLSGAVTPPVFLDPPSIKKFSIGTLCGDGYVKLVAQRAHVELLDNYYGEDNPLGSALESVDGSMRSRIAGPVGVELRNIAGAYVRTLGTIDADLVSPPICIGSRVTVPTEDQSGRPGGSKFYTFEAGA
ncbi:MAG: hypothetical protein JHC87_07540 [Thermoleophilaceae bacterium]|nr:hypothetical protein [Thermoleophilaceae bacterium]